MWECEWKGIQDNLSNTTDIEDNTNKQHIRAHDALCGGRTEAFKAHTKCNQHQKKGYLDVCWLYPGVNALDDHAVGFKQHVDITIGDILSNTCIGLVTCDIEPPKNLYATKLQDNTNGELLLHPNPMKETHGRQ
jgi:hypothetical protein